MRLVLAGFRDVGISFCPHTAFSPAVQTVCVICLKSMWIFGEILTLSRSWKLSFHRRRRTGWLWPGWQSSPSRYVFERCLVHLWEGVVCVREGVRVAASRLRHTSSCVCVVAVRVSALHYSVYYFVDCRGERVEPYVVTFGFWRLCLLRYDISAWAAGLAAICGSTYVEPLSRPCTCCVSVSYDPYLVLRRERTNACMGKTP